MDALSPYTQQPAYMALNDDCFVDMYSMGRRQSSPTQAELGISFYNMDEVRPGEQYAILLTKIDIAQDLKLNCIVKSCEPTGGEYLISVDIDGVTPGKLQHLQEYLK